MPSKADEPQRLEPAAVVLDLDKPVPDALRGAVLALGNFDGVHRGHAELARGAAAIAGERGTRPAAFTFEPHPRSIFRPKSRSFA